MAVEQTRTAKKGKEDEGSKKLILTILYYSNLKHFSCDET